MRKVSASVTRKYQNLRMRPKIIVSVYLILLPLLLIGSGVIYVWNYRNTTQENIQLYQSFAETISENIDYMQQDVLDIADYFAVDNNVHRILSDTQESYKGSGLFWIEDAPLSFVSNILAIKSQIKTTILYPENGLAPYYLSRDASVHDTELAHIRELPVYEATIQAKGDVIWRRVNAGRHDIYLNNRSDKMVAYRMIFDMAKRRRLGVLAIGIEISRYEKICENVMRNSSEGVLILDDQGQELMRFGEVEQSTAEYLEALYKEDSAAIKSRERLAAEREYAFCSQTAKGQLTICYVSPKVAWGVLQQADITPSVILMVLLLILAWPLSAIISSNLSRATQTLLTSMKKFREGDFSSRAGVKSTDEIGQLAQAFNTMAEETQILINRNYVMALKEREIELNALQAQINPHFLYNVLDSLYWEAIDDGNEKLGDDILALSELFRLLLSQGESEIEVRKEIELISRYLQIQQMRFSRRFAYQIDVDESIMYYKISKLLLQPFVENAIVHGFEAKQESGYVHIYGAKEEEMLVFIIEDDGAGMSQEEADRLLETDEESGYPNLRIGHYAIRNIKERLTLRYGERYELKITSRRGEGTRVLIRIPIEH